MIRLFKTVFTFTPAQSISPHEPCQNRPLYVSNRRKYIIHKRRNAVVTQSRPNCSTDFDESGTMRKPTGCSVLISPVHARDVCSTPEISCRCFQAWRFTMKIELKGIELFFEEMSKLRESATCGSSDPGLSACSTI